MRDLCESAERGATVLTASKRLARGLAEAYTAYQRDKGRTVWPTPPIFFLGAFLERCWRDWTFRSNEESPVLLNETQEAALWESVIWESPEGRGLLRVPETAQQAMQAWALLHAYRLPPRAADFAVSGDCEAFFSWTQSFEARREAGRWLEPARLSDYVAGLIRDGRLERPFPVVLAGFDDITPQQRDLFDALCATPSYAGASAASSPLVVPCRDSGEEIRNAALWSRSCLESNPAGRIGVLVPNLESLRAKIERVFFEILGAAFHISLGEPLSRHGIVKPALLLLELAEGGMPIERAGMLLRSPYWRGAQEEQSGRARADAKLRRAGHPAVTIADLRTVADSSPVLYRTLGALEREIRKMAPEQYPSLWSRAFSRILKLAGWPGSRTLSSQEYQIMRAWNKLFSTLATLDAVCGRITLPGALDRLRNLAGNVRMQPEDRGEPVQIAGLLEASGERFDRLWVLGLHDEAMPAPSRPNPFLPIGLQRDHALPHSSAERELEFGAKTMARLAGMAPEIVFSYPQWEGDQPLEPSPLLPRARRGVVRSAFQSWRDRIHAAATEETLSDWRAPELPVGFEQRGGTHMIRDMAACPFRAFALHRLGAKPLEETTLGMNPRERGTAVHAALETIWGELKTHQALLALGEDALRDLVKRHVGGALKESPRLGRTLEAWRLERLLFEWLQVERARPPFVVLEKEEKHEAEIGGVRIDTRIDRVDELPGGRRIIIDYKTGKIKTGAWAGDRPDEPQVPLYCVASRERVAAAAFARLHKGKLEFVGVSESGELGVLKEMKLERGATLAELISEWDRVLRRLGEDFRKGVAAVDPKAPDTCDFCAVTAFCRVKEAHD